MWINRKQMQPVQERCGWCSNPPFGAWAGFPRLMFLVILLLFSMCSSAAEQAGLLVSGQGAVEVWRDGWWQPVTAGAALAIGEMVRTGEGSRAAILLNGGIQIKLSANSQVELKSLQLADAADQGLLSKLTQAVQNLLRLLRGEVWVRSEQPMEIQTLPATATIRGTEFDLAVGPGDDARLIVLSGLVEFHNPQGSVQVAANEQASARQGQAPRKTVLLNPIDAVQWSLYYPNALGDEAQSASDPQSSRYWIQAAQAALLRGEVPQAQQDLDRALVLNPRDAVAYSLRSDIALVQNRKAEALAAAQQAVAADPASPAGYISLSLARQAAFNLDGALAAAQQALERDPANIRALVQKGTLLFGMGQLKDAAEVARQAQRLAPDDAMVNTLWGFLELARMRTDQAQVAFRAAIAQDSTLGLPHLGLGLALFRQNQTEAALCELRQAALLEPLVSLYNSYLGKGFYEVKDQRRAQKYLRLAKELDPHDPTPWLYDAIRLQSMNRPGEALDNIQRSVDLNDNRAVYRSKLLLDDDLATREASQASIYANLGFEDVAQAKATESLSLDPTNYSAHRFLSDSYAGRPDYEIAQVSELLQAQLLQPININPLQPSLLATNLNILARTGLTQMAFNEYMSLFERDQTQLYASGVGGNNGTWGDEMVVSGLNGPFSYSLGQFHYQTDGFRPNSDFQHDLYDVFVQAAVTPELNLQAEYRHRETDEGYLSLNFDDNYRSRWRDSLNADVGRIGGRYSPSPQNTLIASLIYADQDRPFSFNSSGRRFNFDSQINGWQGELQWLYKGDAYNVVSGMGFYRNENSLLYLSHDINEVPTDHDNIYSYANIQLASGIIGTLGGSYDAYNSEYFNLNQFNPKIGLRWGITDHLILRAAAYEVVKRDLLINQTIEPTQIAGFNQLFDDINGTSSDNYGIALDIRFTGNLFAGLEWLRRDLEMPFGGGPGPFEFEKYQVDLSRAYLNWLIDHNWSATLEYRYEGMDMQQGQYLRATYPTQLDTSMIPLNIRYFNPGGFFAGAGVTYVHQDVDYDATVNSRTSGSSDFVLLDATIGYRLPNRWGVIALEGRNLTDEQFQYQDYSFITASDTLDPLFLPERMVLGRFIINF